MKKTFFVLELLIFVLEIKYFEEFFYLFYKNIKILRQITKNFNFQSKIVQIFFQN